MKCSAALLLKEYLNVGKALGKMCVCVCSLLQKRTTKAWFLNRGMKNGGKKNPPVQVYNQKYTTSVKQTSQTWLSQGLWRPLNAFFLLYIPKI